MVLRLKDILDMDLEVRLVIRVRYVRLAMVIN